MAKKKATDKQVKYILIGMIIIFIILTINTIIGSLKPLNYETGLYFGLFMGICLTLVITTKVEINQRKERKPLIVDILNDLKGRKIEYFEGRQGLINKWEKIQSD